MQQSQRTTIASPLLAVRNATATAAASHFFNGGVQHDQEVEDHDPDRQGERIVVVPIDNAVVVIVAIAMGIRGGGGYSMRSLRRDTNVRGIGGG